MLPDPFKVIRRPTSPIWSSPASARIVGLVSLRLGCSTGIENRAVFRPFESLIVRRKTRFRASAGMVTWILGRVGSSMMAGGPSTWDHWYFASGSVGVVKPIVTLDPGVGAPVYRTSRPEFAGRS